MADEDAFTRLVDTHRAELRAHCYRMLGSVHDADDALQETLLRAWRALPRFGGERRHRPWLYRIATNVCLDALAQRPRRALTVELGPPVGADAELGEPLAAETLVEPYPADPEASYEALEAVELAFIAALQHLPARQRAVLILRDVLGFSAAEAAEALDTSVPAVTSALQRARGAPLPDPSQQATLQALGDDRVRAIVARFVHAWQEADVKAIVALLAEDATMAMPPFPSWWRGRETIAAAVARPGSDFHARWRYVPAGRVNGQPAVAAYLWDGDGYAATALDVLALRDDQVAAITAFVRPELFPLFGLAKRL